MDTETYNLVSTAISALTLIALLAYTLYTYRLLKSTQTNAAATQGELEIMQKQLILTAASADSARHELEVSREQLRTSQNALEIQKRKEHQSANPVFVWRGGSKGHSAKGGFAYEINFQNQGGPVAILETRASRCQFDLRPANYIPLDGQGTFLVDSIDASALSHVGIRYMTRDGGVREVVFSLNTTAQAFFSPRVDPDKKYEGLTKMPDPTQVVDILP